MRIESFRAGRWEKQFRYKSFLPETVNHGWEWEDPRLNTLLETASRRLAELDAFSLIVPDIDLFIRLHTVKEASLSSRIEGTETEVETAVLPKEEVPPERRNDWIEVNNYVMAMNHAVNALENLPLSNRLLREAHGVLMQGVRGESKTPGEFRRSQNWIGGSGPSDAAFVPPIHTHVPDLMGDLEKFWHNENLEVPHLVRIAISHYQFETIHPFQDGNGRIGRLMVPLYLIDKKLLRKPSLYISAFLEKNRTSYYDALSRVHTSNDLGQWLRFFLNAITESAQSGIETFQRILVLRKEVDEKMIGLGKRAANARRLMECLYQSAVLSVNEAARRLDVTHQTANALINEFERLGLVEEITGYQRNRLYLFRQYVDLFHR
ncbi:MAG TPA: Fic family protein [Planctomycetota bacterium]|nr:Fic family protein [Planctomycetota bacterium]